MSNTLTSNRGAFEKLKNGFQGSFTGECHHKKFNKTADYFASWLSNERGYYPDALPEIISAIHEGLKILEYCKHHTEIAPSLLSALDTVKRFEEKFQSAGLGGELRNTFVVFSQLVYGPFFAPAIKEIGELVIPGSEPAASSELPGEIILQLKDLAIEWGQMVGVESEPRETLESPRFWQLQLTDRSGISSLRYHVEEQYRTRIERWVAWTRSGGPRPEDCLSLQLKCFTIDDSNGELPVKDIPVTWPRTVITARFQTAEGPKAIRLPTAPNNHAVDVSQVVTAGDNVAEIAHLGDNSNYRLLLFLEHPPANGYPY